MRDYYGFPTMVEWLNPETVEVIDGVPAGPGSYMQPIWRWFGRQISPDDIVHIPWFCMPYRIRGLSPIGAFRSTANVGLGAAEYAAAWFANGGVPPGTFRNSEQLVSREDADMITSRLTSRLQQRKPLVFGRDWVYDPIAIKPNEAQFIETSRLTATEIAVIYGIPPEKIGGTTGSSLTYSTLEQHSLDFLTFSLRPWLVRIESALSNLFPRGQFVKFDTTDLIRADAKTRAQIDQISLGASPPPYRTVDEIRADHDLPPMPKPPLPPAPQPQQQPPLPSGLNGAVSPMKGNSIAQ
jgi:HK97 family phage portal protein